MIRFTEPHDRDPAPLGALSHCSWSYLPPGARAIEASLPDTCRWPLGDVGDADFRFCGSRRSQGSYCPIHLTCSRAGDAR